MPEPVILHKCPHCGRVFDSPSVCIESGEETVPFPAVVPKQQLEAFSDPWLDRRRRAARQQPEGGDAA